MSKDFLSRGWENRTPAKGFGDPYHTIWPIPYILIKCPSRTLNLKRFVNLQNFTQKALPSLTITRLRKKPLRISPRPISTFQLNTLLYLHLMPIYLVVFKGSYSYDGISYLEGGFTLRCLQRLSRPGLATRPCHWYDNRSTSGQSIPVLSY